MGAYKQFIHSGLRLEVARVFPDVKGQAFLGSDDFIDAVKKKSYAPWRTSQRSFKQMRTADELAKETARIFDADINELLKDNRKRALSSIRKAFAFVGRRFYRFRAVDLATYLRKDVSAVSQMINRLGRYPEKVPEVEKLVNLLQK